MTGPTRGRRRRGRRGPRQQPDTGQPQDQQQQAPPSQQGDSGQNARPSKEASRGGGRRQDGGRQAERQGAGQRKRGRGKRRPNRRPAIGPMPSEVLKAPYRDAPPTRRLSHLQLDEVLAGEDVKFGCPMLTRTRLSLPSTGNQPSPRCAMGWAVHSEREVALCLRTPDLLDCWKLDAEREQRLLAELEEDSAAD